MPASAYVIGVSTTPFKRWPETNHKTLAAQAVEAVAQDAGLSDEPLPVDGIWFGNCGLHAWGQANIRGHVCLEPLITRGTLAPHVPIVNVEGGCATGSMALQGALMAVRAEAAECALAIGVEKTFMPHDLAAMKALFEGALDGLDPERWQEEYASVAKAEGLPFEPHPARITLLDVCALEAAWHMKTHGTTAEQIAAAAAKNHDHGALNPNAQYRTPMTVSQVLDDKPVVGVLTRSMCAPISDGSAAALVCSERFLERLDDAHRRRAVRVRASTLTSGRYRALSEPSLARPAAQRAYASAGIEPGDIDVVELHDATSFAELYLTEMLGLCESGEGGRLVESGATRLGGRLPINPSGGLVSKGHPLGASGIAMVHELVTQLRGEAGERQVADARIGLAQNGGGMMGLDEAACAVTILERTG